MQTKRKAILSIFNIALLFSLISFSGTAYSHTTETYHTEQVISKTNITSEFLDYRYDSISLQLSTSLNVFFKPCSTTLLIDTSKKSERHIKIQNCLFLNIKGQFFQTNLLPVIYTGSTPYLQHS